MKPQSEMQRDFAAAIVDPEAPVPAPVTSYASARPIKRFNVYRNNIHAGLRGVLEGRFPATLRLLGDEFFAGTARAFIDAHPPRSPILMQYGEAFAGFLENFEPVADLPYLPDVARIEWAWGVAYHAADADPADPAALEGLAFDRISDAVFTLHPSLGLVCSRYPALTIWTANVGEAEPEPIDAGSGGEDALIIRPGSHVEVRRLPEGGAAFISALKGGARLADAAQAGGAVTGEFDITSNIAGLFQCGAVTRVTLE